MTVEQHKGDSSRRAALVTGAARGLGAAIAAGLARRGFDVAVSSTRVETLAATMTEIAAAGARTVPVALDVRSPASVEQAVAAAVGALGGLDVLVNNAGITARTPALGVTLQEWEAIMQVNVTGTFLMSQQMARHWIGGGRPGCIINMASTHGMIGFPERLAYGTSKGAVIQMTRMLAIEWAPHGVRVNAVAPGTVETASRAAFFAADPERREKMLERVPLRRFATVEEVAGAVCYLASPEAAYITGQTLVLDGGLTAY